MKFFPICVSAILSVCLAQSTVELEGKLQNVIDQTALLKKKHVLLTQLEQIDSQLGIFGDYDIQLKEEKECACPKDQTKKGEENKPKQNSKHPVVNKELVKRRQEIELKKAKYEKIYSDAIETIGGDIEKAKKQLEQDTKAGESKDKELVLKADKEIVTRFEESLKNAQEKLQEQGKIYKLIGKAKSDSAETREAFQNERLILNSIAYQRDYLQILVKINALKDKRFKLAGNDASSALEEQNMKGNLAELKAVKQDYLAQEALMLSKSPSTVGLVVGLLFAFIFVIGAIYFCINKKIMDEDQDQYYMEGGRKSSDDFYEKIL